MFRAVLVCCAVLISGTSFGAIINGDFETGDLTGWDDGDPTAGQTTVVIEDGDYAAKIEVFSDLGYLSQQRSASLGTMFTLATPAKVAFDMKYDLVSVFTESAGYGGVVSIYVSATGISGSIHSNFAESGNTESLPWTTFEMDLAAGTHNLNFSLTRDVDEAEAYANVFVDNLRIVPVPEPSGLILALFGFAITHWGIRRSKCASRP